MPHPRREEQGRSWSRTVCSSLVLLQANSLSCVFKQYTFGFHSSGGWEREAVGERMFCSKTSFYLCIMLSSTSLCVYVCSGDWIQHLMYARQALSLYLQLPPWFPVIIYKLHRGTYTLLRELMITQRGLSKIIWEIITSKSPATASSILWAASLWFCVIKEWRGPKTQTPMWFPFELQRGYSAIRPQR